MLERKKTIICIDSFKYGYLKSAPFLNKLSKRFQHGTLEFSLGFWGGMETFFKGKSDILAFYYHSKDSSLKWTRKFAWLGRWPLNLLINFTRFLKREELFFTYNIPLDKLWMFDTAVKKPLHKRLNVRYVHIGELDKIAHKYGTKSEETKECIKKIDKKLSKMNFDLVFSDHGMIDIKKIIKVPESKICFIDSTMARYWGTKEELNKIKEKLSSKKGKIIKWPDKKYGQLIFLANPGILILPNYWQGSRPCNAMHGYDPKNKDMLGFYIMKKARKRKDFKIKEFNKIFRKWK